MYFINYFIYWKKNLNLNKVCIKKSCFDLGNLKSSHKSLIIRQMFDLWFKITSHIWRLCVYDFSDLSIVLWIQDKRFHTVNMWYIQSLSF